MMKGLWFLVFCLVPVSLLASGWMGNSSIQFKANYFDSYIFRGKSLSDEAVQQVGLGFGLGSWNYDLLHSQLEAGSGPFEQENAHAISVTTVSQIGVTTFGYQFLDYDGSQPDTQELFMRYSRDAKWHSVVDMSYDFDTYKGYFLDYSFSRLMPLTRQSGLLLRLKADLAFELKPKVGRGGELLEPGYYDKDGLVHYQAGAQYVWHARRWVKFEASYDYHWMKDDLLRAAIGGKNHETVAGASLTISIP